MSLSRRRFPRHALVGGERLPVRLEVESRGSLTGTLVELSLGGAALDVLLGPWVPELGLPLRLYVELPGLGQEDFLLCQVAHRRPRPAGFRVGLRFITSTYFGQWGRLRAALTEFIELVRRERISSCAQDLLGRK
jgi:hypothetical protein